MSEKNTEKIVFTDTGSSVFVDINNNNEFSTENLEQPPEISPKEPETAENSAQSGSFTETKAKKQINFFDEENKTSFTKDFPDVDLDKLKNREDFQSFLRILVENPTLSQAYACFNTISASIEEKAEKRAAQALANAKSSVGSLAAKESGEEVFFTKEQVLKMSAEEIKRNYTKIRNSQARW